MANKYRQIISRIAPPVVLLDMDSVLVDWDEGFWNKWQDRSPIDRSLSHSIEECLIGDAGLEIQAKEIYLSKGVFRDLVPMDGALKAMKQMEKAGLKLFICTTPIAGSEFCSQEKLDWVKNYLGENWVDRVILTANKTLVVGDILIDDKLPKEFLRHGRHATTAWKQIVFDAPYNRKVESGVPHCPRMFHWRDWQACVYPIIGS